MSLSKVARRVLVLVSGVLLGGASVLAQQDRIVTSIDASRRIVLQGDRSFRARLENDGGRLASSERISGITILLKGSASQRAALQSLLEQQRDPTSPNYHRWLTPEEYADRFGLSRNDFQKAIDWLRSQGFSADYKARARNWIGFSGTVGQIQTTFHVEIHRYIAAGETHYANAADPEIPAALAPVVLVIRGLDDFRLKPGVRNNKPHFTTSDGTHAVGPADLATIYDINPLYQAGITGSGQTIAVVGQTNIQMSDIENFRSTFGLSANDPQLVLVAGFPDPGITQDEGEADLDLEYAGGIAPDAQILFVYSTDVVVSAQYAIDQGLAPIISMSYGACEQKITSGPESATAIQSFAQEANAQGITWVASAGDPGAAGCEEQQVDVVGVSGLAVQNPASTPEVTGVGGLEFNDGNGSGYWNTTYDSHGGSAVSYIPEMVWNDTALEGDLAAGGGGASVIFPKPAWQTGPGVPNDNARDVPDVAFTASWDHDPYILFTGGNIIPNGGTSAATPSFAGMLALLNEYLVSNGVLSGPGLGNINPTLYTLAQNTTNVFHDITVGSNIVPCAAGSPGCDTGSYGYSAGPEYDQASGLGSIDVSNLAIAWAGSSTKPSTSATNVTAVADPASIVASATTVLTATVTAATGSASLTGSVSFSLGQTALGSANLSGAGGAAIASLTVYGSQLPVGDNMITVSYSGCNGFAASSGSVAVTVSVPTASSAIIPSVVPNPVYEEEPDSDGYSWFYTVKLTEIAGVSTTLNRFSIDANDYSADIDTWFGSTTIPANGTLSADIRSKLASVPVNRVFILGGVDASGQSWTQQISVPFYGKQLSAAMTLSSSPSSEIQNPNGDPNCDADYPYYQQLNLQELNGYEIHLTRFLAGGNDFSGQIAEWFGSWRLAPLGALQAGICWKLDNAPVTLSYEIDGVDTDGNEITATLSVPFQGPQQSAGGLSASEDSVSMAADVSQSATATVAVNVSSAEKWSVSVFPANQNSSWLVVFPLSGAGSSEVKLVASAAGMESGVYTATLVFQSVNTIPQFVNVPITFVIGASNSIGIEGVANGASFEQAFAPGMILDVFGRNLADSAEAAPAVPLPFSLAGASVTVNGAPAPLYYASPTQLNIQIPYETAAGTAILGVNHRGQVASYLFEVQASAPGIFVGSSGELVPTSSGAPGGSLPLFVTGVGDVMPMLDTGDPPANGTPVNKLPAPRLPLSLTVGGVEITPLFVGIPCGLVGVTQINFTVPPNVPRGTQPVVVTVGGVASKPASFTVK